MEHLGQVTFDWDNGRVGVGKTWVTVHKTLSGATSLARARVAKQEGDEIAMVNLEPDIMICSKLPARDKETLRQITSDFDHVFSLHPKRPK